MTCVPVSIAGNPEPDIYIHTINVNDLSGESSYTVDSGVSTVIKIKFRNRGTAAGSLSYTMTTKDSAGSVVDSKTYQTPSIPAKTTSEGEHIATYSWTPSNTGTYTVCIEVA